MSDELQAVPEQTASETPEERRERIRAMGRANLAKARAARGKPKPALHETPEFREAVRAAVWKAYKAAPIHAKMKEDFDKKQASSKDRTSPYTVKEVGKRPKNGWPLVFGSTSVILGFWLEAGAV